MKKQSLWVTGLALLTIFLSSVTLAGPMGGGTGRSGTGPGSQGKPAAQMTEQQQADWKAWQEKKMQLRKEYLVNLVKSGALTQEQADARIKAMEANHSFRTKNGFAAPGSMYGAKLTDEQKTEMKQLFEQRLEIRKQALAEYVKSCQITQAQADQQIKRMQDNFNYKLENGFGARGKNMGFGMGRGGKGSGPHF